MTQSELKQYQLEKARNIVNYTVAHSKFFRDYYKGYDLDDVWHLPTVNKKIMMEHLSDYNTIGLTKEEILKFCLEIEKSRDFAKRLKGNNVAMSSGTSGNKGVEIDTPREEIYLRAAFFARFPFLKGEKLNIAFILRVSAPAFNLHVLGHKMTYISQLNTIENIRKDLQTLNPNIVSAPPTMLKILAKELELKHYSIHPKRLISYAEVLSPEDRIYIEKIFQCKIFETYKCTEGAIGMPCSLGKLHVSEDLLAVHLYNSDGTPTPPGTPCYKMIVTDLHKTSQPFIQYELNDIITISKTPCECGSSFRVIERIQGRGDDIFWGQRTDKNELHFIFPDYISRAIITSSEEIEEYQAIQKSFDNILVRIELKKDAKDTISTTENITKNIEQVFLAYNCKKPQITVAFEKPQINPNSLKLIRIHREFKVEEK